MRYAAGYLRRSVATKEQPGNASREVQLAAIHELCGQGLTPKLYEDWDVSGNGRSTHKRASYLRLKADVAAGRVSLVAAYSLSRLGRSVREVYELVELCMAHGTTVVTKVDGIDLSTANGRALFGVLAVFAQLESDLASERTTAGLAAVKAKGTQLGNTPIGFRRVKQPEGLSTFEPDGSADAIVDAYKTAGTLSGTARLLAERGILTPRGKGGWSNQGLRSIIDRHAPDLLPRRRPSGIRRRGKHALSGLMVCGKCPDKAMTPDETHGGLYCSNGRSLGVKVHGSYTVQYRRVMPLIEAEAAKYIPSVVAKHRDDTSEKRRAIADRKARVGEAYEDGAMDRVSMKAKVAALDAELAALGDRDDAIASLSVEPAGVDWTAEPKAINEQLRKLFSRITLNPSYMSLDVEWRLPRYMWDQEALAEYEAELAEAAA